LQSLSLKRLEFGSLLAYCPRPAEVSDSAHEEATISHNLVLAMKTGRLVGKDSESVSAYLARFLSGPAESVRKLSALSSRSSTLVPIPRSSLPTKDGLWVPDQLARELVHVGFGDRVVPLLERTEPIPKAATSISAERPSAVDNYRTLKVNRGLESPTRSILVDDVVTAGATLIGSANRLTEAFPGVPICGFTAARTIHGPEEFRQTLDPVIGVVVLYPSGRTHREP
jgi:hypothetical protein